MLLETINKPLLPAQTHARYKQLSQQLHANNISPTEYDELLQLVDDAEQADAKRVQALFELAQLRNVPLDNLMQQLGIQTPVPHV